MIGWITTHWLGLSAGGLVLAGLVTLIVMNPLAAARLASQVAGWVLDAGRKAFAWLRKPGHTLMATCALFAALAVVAGIWSFSLNREIVVVTQARDTAVDERDTARTDLGKATTRIGELESSLATYRLQEQDYARIQRERTEALRQAQQESTQALAMLAAQQAAAERSSKAWWQQYAKRPDSCKAAQEALDVACSGVGEF